LTDGPFPLKLAHILRAVQMRFFFSDPYRQVAGAELEFSLPIPVSLRALIGRLPPDLIEMIHYKDSASDVELCAHVMFFNKVRLLRLDDMVSDDDVVKVLLPATGG
jgi:hypothetical protein